MEAEPPVSLDHEMRRTGFGSTDTAAIFGVDPWRDAYSVWTSKHFPPREDEQTPEKLLGQCLQRGIFDYYKATTGYNAEWRDQTVRHPQIPWLVGTPDAVVPDLRKVVEIKTILHNHNQWGSPEDGDIPEHYLMQAWHQMALLDYDTCDLVPLVRGGVQIYTIRRDPEVEKAMLQRLQEFWTRYIVGDEEPPIGPSEWTTNWIKQRFPNHRPDLRNATEEEVEWLESYADIREALEPLEERKAELENRLRRAVADNEGIVWENGKFTWKKTKDSEETDWHALACELLAHYPSNEEAQRLLARWTQPKPGHRRMRFVCDRATASAA